MGTRGTPRTHLLPLSAPDEDRLSRQLRQGGIAAAIRYHASHRFPSGLLAESGRRETQTPQSSGSVVLIEGPGTIRLRLARLVRPFAEASALPRENR